MDLEYGVSLRQCLVSIFIFLSVKRLATIAISISARL